MVDIFHAEERVYCVIRSVELVDEYIANPSSLKFTPYNAPASGNALEVL